MKQNKRRILKIFGWFFLFLSIGLFLLQMGVLFLQSNWSPLTGSIQYIDNRLFYLINILFVVFLALALLFLFTFTKKGKWIGTGIVAVFLVLNGIFLVDDTRGMNHITSISPDWNHVLSIKENTESGVAVYYRSYYGIFARPNEILPYETVGEFDVEWLEDDIAAVTYNTADGSVQQFIGTYGDRGSGRSYYNVGPEIQGIWQGNGIEVISNTEGISVTKNHHTERFAWDEIEQFGTLAVVLKKNNEAVWTIGLNKNFEVHPDASRPTVGNITIYQATMGDSEPITLEYQGAI